MEPSPRRNGRAMGWRSSRRCCAIARSEIERLAQDGFEPPHSHLEIQPAVRFRNGTAWQHKAVIGLIDRFGIAHTPFGNRGAAQTATAGSAAECGGHARGL